MPKFAPLIFVSSTREDLALYREELVKTMPSLDVLFRGMEYFGARPRKPYDVMLSELRKCDLYLGILAHRYGSVEKETQLSFTELEYREAKRINLPIFFFLIDPVHPVDPTMMEKRPQESKKLSRLKAEISEQYTTTSFTTPEDLAHQCSFSIRTWVDEWQGKWAHEGARPTRRERRFIDDLYAEDSQSAKRAVQALRNLQSAAALEHFLVLVRSTETSNRLKEAILATLNEFENTDRPLDVLLAALKSKNSTLKALAVFLIGERALLGLEITASAFNSLVSIENDDDDVARTELAHALGKIGDKQRSSLGACLEILERLMRDRVPSVRERARGSIASLAREPGKRHR